ncbi:uncharacterized protein MELLADRAFT_77034 [Melampsora larici-populina 98AG31]|uniref:Secreted protein n=1 Tax=Melampsora larici-populina (strain 98AG31 / pathotype 3-4-7) TaxID=747676 RepID=F4RCJ6_MELLP|nr:uncharacterized protein MELLADRAFT_77034 [Melampsora larici-populina 98AG31]EGG09746.1 secreted protein [Melampsora larici-populina 98AG31]
MKSASLVVVLPMELHHSVKLPGEVATCLGTNSTPALHKSPKAFKALVLFVLTQIHTMVIQFQAMVTQFSNAGGCNVCQASNAHQFTSAITPVFQQFQTMITIITQSYSSYIPQCQSDFNILYSCLRIVTGILVSLNINVSSLFSSIGLDLNLFSVVGINIQVLLTLDVTDLFSAHGLVGAGGLL